MFLGIGQAISSTQVYFTYRLPVQMRTAVVSINGSGLAVYNQTTSTSISVSSLSINQTSSYTPSFIANVTGATTGTIYNLFMNGASNYIEFNADL